MGVGVAVGVELRPLWIRERRVGARAKLLLSFGGVKGSRTRTGWAAGDGELGD